MYSLLDISTDRIWSLDELSDGSETAYVAGSSLDSEVNTEIFDTNTGEVVRSFGFGFGNSLVQLKSGYLAIGYAENFIHINHKNL